MFPDKLLAFVDPASGINPFSLQNGALVITAVRANSTIAGPAQWASGLISTMGSFSQQYGYFEMRAELPTETGVWPAFWLRRPMEHGRRKSTLWKPTGTPIYTSTLIPSRRASTHMSRPGARSQQ